MDYNLATLRHRVIVDKLDDEEYDTKIIDNFINDTIRDIYNQFELSFQEKIFHGTVPEGTAMFELPEDLSQLQSYSTPIVFNFRARKLHWRDFFGLYPSNTTREQGEPENWTLYGGNVIFSRPTNQNYTLTIYYIKKPTLLTDDLDVPEVPEEFAELLILGAYVRVLKRNEDFDQAAYMQTEYDKMLDLLVARYGARDTQGVTKMKNRQIQHWSK